MTGGTCVCNLEDRHDCDNIDSYMSCKEGESASSSKPYAETNWACRYTTRYCHGHSCRLRHVNLHVRPSHKPPCRHRVNRPRSLVSDTDQVLTLLQSWYGSQRLFHLPSRRLQRRWSYLVPPCSHSCFCRRHHLHHPRPHRYAPVASQTYPSNDQDCHGCWYRFLPH